jgi:hypothetical protein
MSATIIAREKEDVQVGGLIPHLVEGAVPRRWYYSIYRPRLSESRQYEINYLYLQIVI